MTLVKLFTHTHTHTHTHASVITQYSLVLVLKGSDATRLGIYVGVADLDTHHCLRPLTHASETSSTGLNLTSGSGASFSCRCTTSNVIDCLRGPNAVNNIRSRASARKTSARIWRRIYGADFWSQFLSRALEKYLHMGSMI